MGYICVEMSKKGIFKIVMANIFAMASLLAISEFTYRRIKSGERIYRDHELLGWAPKENVLLEKNLQSSKGRVYKSRYRTNFLGIREIEQFDAKAGSIDTLKVLAIGDSFTGSNIASNEDMWFGVIHRLSKGRLNMNAYGMGGSGTTQQYIAFKILRDVIDPDILVIQYCTNDPGNDSLRYGLKSILRNQDLRRPYYKDGEFFFREDSASKVYRFFYQSYLFSKARSYTSAISIQALFGLCPR